MIRVLVVAPYPGLAQLVTTIAQDYLDLEIRVEIGNLEDSLQFSRQAEREGYDVILSRGGTMEYLMEQISLPVLSIPVSGYDVLRSVALVQNLSGKKAVVGFSAITRGYEAVNLLMKTEMEIVTIQNRREVLPTLERLKASGVTFVIGDVITVHGAKTIGMEGMLVTSGEESVRDALDQVQPYLAQINRYRSRAEALEQILAAVPDTRVCVYNDRRELMFPSMDTMDRELNAYLSLRATEMPERSRITGIYAHPTGVYYQLSGRSLLLEDGQRMMLFSLRESENNLAGSRGIQMIDLTKNHTLSYSLYHTKSAGYREMTERILLLARARAPILLEGEYGTGKRNLGLLLFKDMAGPTATVITLDCAQIEPDGVTRLFEDIRFSGRKDGKLPLFLYRLHELSKKSQERMLSYSQQFPRFLLIATAEQNMEAMVQVGAFSRELLAALGFSRVWVPALRQRKEDIEDLTSSTIMLENERVGKQVVGLEKEAMALFQRYEWPRNLAQLRSVLHEAVKLADTPYITAKVVSVLLSSDQDQQAYSGVIDIGPGRTLEAIEHDILMAVLRDENMNQTRAAERLGISRTTFWRKIK